MYNLWLRLDISLLQKVLMVPEFYRECNGRFFVRKPQEMCANSCHQAYSEGCSTYMYSLSVCSHLTTIHPNKLQICCMTFQANINKPENFALYAIKSLLLCLKSRQQLIQMTFSCTWEAMWKKRRVAEGPRPLVSFSLQQLHLLLSTAQQQRSREGQKDQGREPGAGCHV